MLHECRATHVICVIWDAEDDGNIPLLNLTEVNVDFRSISGQIRSNIKIQKFLTKTYKSYPVLCHDTKNVIFYYLRQLKMPKIAFKKNDGITFSCFFFFTITQPNIKILLLNLVCVLFVCSFTTCIPVLRIPPKFWILKALIFF